MGGADSNTVGTNWIQIYDPVSNTWRVDQNTSAFNPRRCACAVAYNANIYVLGGLEDTTGNAVPYPSNEVLEYSPGNANQSAWHFKSSSGFTPREQASCAVLDNKIYVFGGTVADGNPGAVQLAVEVYDPLRDRWADVQQIGWTRRQQSASAAIAGKIYVFGGHQSGGAAPALSTFEVLNTKKVGLYWFRKN